MHYYFSTDTNEPSYIVLGDTNGSVIIMAFQSAERGPFKQHPAHDTITLRYDDLIKVYTKIVILQNIYMSNIHNYIEIFILRKIFVEKLLQIGKAARIKRVGVQEHTFKVDESGGLLRKPANFRIV